MKRYWTLVGAMLTFFLLLFLLVEWLQVPLLADPSRWLERGGVWTALLGVGLLIADVVLPVPSSLVMIAHGTLFGVAWGTLLSLIGSVGAALTGFALGRRGGKWLERIVPAEDRARIEQMLERWGALAIVVTRPVPLLAETTAVMAGASTMTWRRAALAALAGSLPAALLYALTGAVAAGFQNGALMFGLVILVSGVFWWFSRWLAARR
ncbi:MAG TPA: VTT domain-containing protein [Blastocatellia bacterium]|nr:VTT domain-containing protein [Blastocatellia bacterium]HMX27252.1 VTT domain-containing protein [Blastocatellia bacterium]HMY75551.1 VTT domain-containing protein [Blastocatellia bacterium]HMZ22796.1 VTT domain-containing protein [Blastocatellia bacterium]HNG29814.1 VTT domain-containing protein [Blastocatellia bacterium]